MHREEYRAHLRNEHRDYSDEALENQLIHGAETSLTSSERCCPICAVHLETARALHSHIGLHLERFSLFALPRSVDDDNNDSNEDDSDKANIASEGSRDEAFDSDLHVEDDNDRTASIANIARQRWKLLLDRVLMDLKVKRIVTPVAQLPPQASVAQEPRPKSTDPLPHTQRQVFIAMMGKTGTGKTTFINQISGQNLQVGHGLQSCMSS